MKRGYILFIVILIAGILKAQDKKVAVFDPAGNVDNNVKEVVREEISSVVVNTVGYIVLERQLINKVLEESKFQKEGMVDDSQISEIGKMMGANYVFVSSISMVDKSTYYISFKMIDVLTARIEKQKTATTSRSGLAELINVVQKTVKEMFGMQQNEQKISAVQNNNNIVSSASIIICGIEVMLEDLPGKYTWNDAMYACPNGWRLPTSEELECICEQKKRNGLEFKGRQYWTNNQARRDGKAISITINDCKEEDEDKDDSYPCKCVRNR